MRHWKNPAQPQPDSSPKFDAAAFAASYRVNDRVLKLVRLYTARFPRKADAARQWGLPESELEAMLSGKKQVLKGPQFWSLVAQFGSAGVDEADLLAIMGASAWKEALEFDTPSGVGDPKGPILDALIEGLATGRTDYEENDPELVESARKGFGNLGLALRAAMRRESKAVTPRVSRHMARRDVQLALEALNQYETVLYNYLVKLYRGDRPLEKAKAENIIAHIRPYMKLKEAMRESIEEALEASDWAIYPDKTACDKIHRKKTLDFHRWRLARRYSADSPYRLDEYLHHPGLGLGRVVEILNRRRILVRFDNETYGIKELTANLGAIEGAMFGRPLAHG